MEMTRKWTMMLIIAALLIALAGMAAADGDITSWAALQEQINGAAAGDTLTLTRDLTAGADDASLEVNIGKAVTLDLNGYTLDRGLTEAGGPVLTVGQGTTLTITDSSAGQSGSVTGGYAENGGGIVNHGTLVMEGGSVTGNSASANGGGVHSTGSFELKGGAVTGNHAANHGGGVYASGTFKLNGGTISSNEAGKNAGGVFIGGIAFMQGGSVEGNSAVGDGGGVCVEGTLAMSGGSITGNTAKYSAGGIRVSSGTTTISGGVISDNTAQRYHGGAIYVADGATLNLYGGEITGNTAAGQGGGILVSANAGSVNVQGNPLVTGNTAANGENIYLRPDVVLTVTGMIRYGASMGLYAEDGERVLTSGYGANNSSEPLNYFFGTGTETACLSDGEVRLLSGWKALQARANTAQAGAELSLNENLTAASDDGALTIPAGQSIVLDLNGYTLDRGLTEATANGSVIVVEEGAALTVRDSSELQTGTITGGFEETNGGGILNRGTLRLQGGDIMNNNAGYWGGGVFNIGTLIMTGGKVSYNQAADGAGIYNVGTMTMSGGDVVCNTASADGGGVYTTGTMELTGGSITGNTAEYSAGGIRLNGGTTTLNGGVVSDNTAVEYHGGGIYAGGGGVLSLYGGEITGNTAAGQGGGILVNADAGSVNVQGKPLVYGNTAAKGENIYMRPGKVLTVTGELSKEAALLVHPEYFGVLTSGFSTYNTVNSLAAFFPCEEKYSITLRGGEAVMGPLYLDRYLSGDKVVYQEALLTDYTLITSSTTVLNSGSYTIDRDVTVSGRLEISGHVSLILPDGSTLTCEEGVHLPGDSSLTIYGQQGDTGKLIAHTSWESTAGIGGNNRETPGLLVISGGTIDAEASKSGAGIGSGFGANGGTVYIYGGSTKATCWEKGAGIGGGNAENTHGGTVYIYGGRVEAWGGKSAAGIGGGYEGMSGTIYITGADTWVKAVGGEDAAGIGGGDEGGVSDACSITIMDGEVHAQGGMYAAGIGGGDHRSNPHIVIRGGSITAYGGVAAAGIGTGNGAGSYGSAIDIYGGTITATGGSYHMVPHTTSVDDYGAGAGIGGGNASDAPINIWGGTITATGGDGVVVGNTLNTGAAGIGTGGYVTTWADDFPVYEPQHKIRINSCTRITAVGGTFAAGIGSGGYSSCPNIIISGGNIEATGHDGGAGIGSGLSGSLYNSIAISGGNIRAASVCAREDYKYYGAGIGTGGAYNSDESLTLHGTISITGGTVYAAGSESGAGIGSGRGAASEGFIEIGGGSVTAVGGAKAAALGATEKDSCCNMITVTGGSVHLVPGIVTVGGNGDSSFTLNLGDAMCVRTADGYMAENARESILRGKNEVWVDICAHPGISEWVCESVSFHRGVCPYCLADPVEGHSCDEDGVCAVCGYFLQPGWQRLQALINGAADGAVFTLTEDMAAADGETSLTFPAEKSITLDLNGHTLSRTHTDFRDDGSVLTVRGGLILKDSTGGGRISGGYAARGGGILVTGVLDMEGGTVSGNHASSGGGGICCEGGTVNVTGGVIADNLAENGGGVYLAGGTAELNNCAVTGNAAAYCGGGILCTAGGGLKLAGTAVIGNSAEMLGGGVYADGGLSVEGAVSVLDNTAPTGPNVHLATNALITFTGPLTSGARIGVAHADAPCVFTSDYGKHNTEDANTFFFCDESCKIVEDGGEARLELIGEWGMLQALLNNAENGSTLSLSADTTAQDVDTALTVPAGKSLTLDLNGFTLNRSLTAMETDGSVIIVPEGAALTLTDSVGGSSITGGYAENGGGIHNLGTLTLNGVAIAQNRASGSGGGIYNGGTVVMTSSDVAINTADGRGGGVYNAGQMTVSGGNITVNTTASGDGGGVYSTGTFDMTGGGITGNTAYASAGGLRVCGGEASLNNVSVKGNTATTYHGGGVFVSDSGVLNLNGGTVTENTAAMQGGGILVHASAGTVGIQGTVSVVRNTAANGNNIYLRPGKVLTVTGALGDGASLYVTLEKGAGVATSGLGDNGTIGNFTSDSGSYICGITAEDEARMDVPATVTFDPNGGSGTQTQASVALNTLLTLPESTLTPLEGTTFAGWLTDTDGTVTAAGDTLLISAEETIISAAWSYDMGTPDFVLPTGTATVEAGAFEGIAAAKVYIPDGCTAIGEGAFSNCPNLKAVRVPAGCAFAEGDNPFDGCPAGLYILSTGSGLADFCSANGYHLVIEAD